MAQRHPRKRFSEQEDRALKALVKKYGANDWNKIAGHMPSPRNARQCRHRYTNYLDGVYRPSPWTEMEDALIISMFHEVGPKWVFIAKSLNGRTGNDVKNRWHKHITKSSHLQAYTSPPLQLLSSDNQISSPVLTEIQNVALPKPECCYVGAGPSINNFRANDEIFDLSSSTSSSNITAHSPLTKNDDSCSCDAPIKEKTHISGQINDNSFSKSHTSSNGFSTDINDIIREVNSMPSIDISMFDVIPSLIPLTPRARSPVCVTAGPKAQSSSFLQFVLN